MRKPIVLLFIFLCLAGSLHAQRRGDVQAPPPVVSQSLTVKPGETVTIPLTIHGTRGQQLDFLVRSQPRYGKLSEVRAVGVNSAQVSYTAPAKGAEEDRFTYAVRNADGVSAPGVVSISIVAPPTSPARLVAPEQLDFPQVFTGERSTAELELRNTGGTALDGVASVPMPWSIEGEKRYHIPPGKSIALKLTLVSEKAGLFSDTATLGPQPSRSVALNCEVKDPLTVSPVRLTVGAKRKAVLQITNHSGEERVVNIKTDGRLIVTQQITVPAKETVAVPVTITVEDSPPAATEEELEIQSSAWLAKVPVNIQAMKATTTPVIAAQPPMF